MMTNVKTDVGTRQSAHVRQATEVDQLRLLLNHYQQTLIRNETEIANLKKRCKTSEQNKVSKSKSSDDADKMTTRLAEQELLINKLRQDMQDALDHYEAIRTSTLWRALTPVRWVIERFRSLRHHP